jgi:hypothetical protein
MLNPSIANENTEDRTINRCISFAQKLRYGSLQVVNLFAYRSTKPEGLLESDIEPVGNDND